MTLTYGSLFSGYGGLEKGVQSVLPGRTAWHVEFDRNPSRILAHHHPDVPNYGDVTTADWDSVEPVDVLTGGYPCQPFSHAGRREGTNDERHLWPYVAEAVAALRPGLCVFENVRGHLNLGFDQVLRDLHQLDYDVHWYSLRAADIGAAHGRMRLFIFAKDKHSEHPVRSRADRRRGLHRDSGGRRVAPPAPEGGDVRQGGSGTTGPGLPIWREGHAGQESDGHAPLVAGVDDHRRAGGAGHRAVEAVPAGEGTSGRRGAGVPGAAPVAGAVTASGPTVDRRGQGEGEHAEASDSGSEPAGAGPGPAEAAPGDAAGCVPLGLVVGAGGRPVRASGVHGEVSDVRPDACGACVRPPELVGAGARLGLNAEAHEVPLFPTPAVNDMGAGKTVEAWDAWTDRMKSEHGNGNGHGKSLHIEAQRLLPTPRATDGTKGGPNQAGSSGDLMLPSAVQPHRLLPTPKVGGSGGGCDSEAARNSPSLESIRTHFPVPQHWGDYAPAIARWEQVMGRPAPDPTEPGAKGSPRLSATFVEWLMGLPEGHVTDPAIGISRNSQLKALGNGVVPQQAAAATAAWVQDMQEEGHQW